MYKHPPTIVAERSHSPFLDRGEALFATGVRERFAVRKHLCWAANEPRYCFAAPLAIERDRGIVFDGNILRLWEYQLLPSSSSDLRVTNLARVDLNNYSFQFRDCFLSASPVNDAVIPKLSTVTQDDQACNALWARSSFQLSKSERVHQPHALQHQAEL